MQAIITGPWRLKESKDNVGNVADRSWCPPEVQVTGTLDLSSIGQQSEPSNQQSRGFGLWEVDVDSLTDISSDYEILATDTVPSEAVIGNRERRVWKRQFGVRLGSDVNTIEQAYVRSLREFSDPTGSGIGPLMPTKRNSKYVLETNLGHHKHSETFAANDPHRAKWRDKIHRQLKKITDKHGPDAASKVFGFIAEEQERQTGERVDVNTTNLLTKSLRRKGVRRLKPSTTVIENWDNLDDWTTDSGGFNVVANELFGNGSISKGYHATALSSSDMYVEALCDSDTYSKYVAICNRLEDFNNYYWLQLLNSVSVVTRFLKYVGGVFSVIDAGEPCTILETLKVDSLGSNHDLYKAGINYRSYTDTALTDGLLAGILIGSTITASVGPLTFSDGISGGGGGSNNTTQQHASCAIIQGL